MKVYVAGKFSAKIEIQGKMQELEKLGHTITHDWTWHIVNDNNDLKRFAELDIQGVRDAELLIAIMDDPDYEYRGTFTEIGCALGLERPVIIVGPWRTRAASNCFFHHPSVIHVKNWLDIPHQIEQIRVQQVYRELFPLKIVFVDLDLTLWETHLDSTKLFNLVDGKLEFRYPVDQIVDTIPPNNLTVLAVKELIAHGVKVVFITNNYAEVEPILRKFTQCHGIPQEYDFIGIDESFPWHRFFGADTFGRPYVLSRVEHITEYRKKTGNDFEFNECGLIDDRTTNLLQAAEIGITAVKTLSNQSKNVAL